MKAWRGLVVALGFGLCALVADVAWAQSGYPSHPVRIVVPTVAGGTVDVVIRTDVHCAAPAAPTL